MPDHEAGYSDGSGAAGIVSRHAKLAVGYGQPLHCCYLFICEKSSEALVKTLSEKP
jgi:hypothetical protein